jgi:hypothetical protein
MKARQAAGGTEDGGAPRVARRWGPALRLVVAVFLIVGAFALGAAAVRPALVSHDDTVLSLPPVDLPGGDLSSAPPPPAGPGASGTSSPSTPDVEAGLPHAVPVSVSVPRVGISARTTDVGLDGNGEVQVPTDNQIAGWYSGGPAPGDPDIDMPAVVVGHVDSWRGPAVFYRLREVRPGDTVSVRRADGSTAVFVVYRVAEYLKAKFPAAQVFGPTSRPELRLITCTGQFDRSARSYLSNFVAYAVLRQPVPAATPHATPHATPPATPHPLPGAPQAPVASGLPGPVSSLPR